MNHKRRSLYRASTRRIQFFGLWLMLFGTYGWGCRHSRSPKTRHSTPSATSAKSPSLSPCKKCSYKRNYCPISWKDLRQKTLSFLQMRVSLQGKECSGTELYRDYLKRWSSFLQVLQCSLPCMDKSTLNHYRHFLEIESDGARSLTSEPFPAQLSKRVVNMIVQLDILRRASYMEHWSKQTRSSSLALADAAPRAKDAAQQRSAGYVYTAKDLERFKPQRSFLRWPARGRISSLFGLRRDPIHHKMRMHKGIDIAAPFGTPVFAAADGLVLRKGWMGGCGLGIMIQHPKKFRTLYCHLSQLLVAQGSHLRAGTVIGRIGSTGRSTGSHLHFGLFRAGQLIDPAPYLQRH